MNITRKDFTAGWTPQDDPINGRKNGLLLAHNVIHDDQGSLTLAYGTRVVGGPYEAPVVNLFSKTINTTKHRFIHLRSGKVLVDGATFFEGGSPSNCSFLSSYGQVFAFSGLQRYKYNGADTKNVGLDTPGQPVCEPIGGPVKSESDFSDWSLWLGANLVNLGDGVQVDTDSLIAQVYTDTAHDFKHLSDGSLATPEDGFFMNLRIHDTSNLSFVQVVFQCGYEGGQDNPTDYYQYSWYNTNDGTSPFVQGRDVWSVLSCLRSDFSREGNNSQLDWENIGQIWVTIQATSEMAINVVGEMHFAGGTQAPLSGRYEYCQVAVRQNINYQCRSQASQVSQLVEVTNGYVNVTPAYFDQDATELWLFRRSADASTDVTAIGKPAKLDKFYRIGVISPASETVFEDRMSDLDALREDVTFDTRIVSLRYLEDEILGACGPISGRNLLMTARDVIITDFSDVESYFPQQLIRLSSNSTERNCFIAQISNSVVIVGTTKEIYEISGTFTEQPDGSLDVVVRALGCEYPPLSRDFTYEGGMLYYVSANGWRQTNGVSNTTVSHDLDGLFNYRDRYNVLYVSIIPNDNGRYPVAFHQNKLYTFNPLHDGSVQGFVFNFTTKCLEQYFINPLCVCTEDDNVMLAGFEDAYIREVAFGDTMETTPGSPVGINALVVTPFDDNGQPRNRKDSFTLKVRADTGNKPVSIQLAKNYVHGLGNYVEIGTASFNGLTEHLFDLSTFGYATHYSLRIYALTLNKFRFVEYTIEYNPLPEQLTYMRIPYTNLGTMSRKRFIAFAFVVDTLGANVTFTPLVDGIALEPETINLDRKGTHIHYFREDVIGTDIGGVLSGGTFEYYELNLQDCVSEKLPTPTKYLVIPANDYGSPNRKRHSSYKFQINTRSGNVQFTPIIDGVAQTASIINTTSKATVEYFFTSDTVGIDIGGILESLGEAPFEFYGVVIPQQLELLPPRLKYLKLPTSSYGTPSRKRFSSFKFLINTRFGLVKFTPIVDNNSYPSIVFQTVDKELVEYFFDDDTTGKDIGGVLESLETTPFEFYDTIVPQEVETLPARLKYFLIPANNYGSPNRKRHSSYKFQINTNSVDVRFTPYIDGTAKEAFIFQTTAKQTIEYFFLEDTIGIECGGVLESIDGTEAFEFYGVIVPQDLEQLPPRLKYFNIPANNYGSPNRKRHSSYKFQINTNGADVYFRPIVDGVSKEAQTVNTESKTTVEYFFTEDTVGIEVGGSLESVDGTEAFEFYGVIVPQEIEMLPPRLKYFKLPPNDYNTPNRKRFSSFKFQINTNGADVTFTPIIDDILKQPTIVNTSGKETVEYFFNEDTIGIDISGVLEGTSAFEFYGIVVPQQVETLPPRLKYFLIPPNDYGNPNRKRHSSYKFQINTNGQPVRFTPILDGTPMPPQIFTNISKGMVEYYFTDDTIGIEVGGILESVAAVEAFEFYGVVIPQEVELMPARLKYFKIPPSDYGSPNRKRHSSYKFQINTNGANVTFTPIVDGISYTPAIFNTPSKKTVEYFFTLDVIGIDIDGILSGDYPFEFYQVVVPQQVEMLPPRLTFLVIPPSDYGQPNRKRHSSYKFQINTNSAVVRFTPIIDGVYKTSALYTTVSKGTVEHFFTEETFGIDIGGTLESTGSVPFEFYQVIVPQEVEIMAPRLKEFKGPSTNFGTAGYKRIRTLPIDINTNGSNVTVIPFIDRVRQPSSTITTASRGTAFHYFAYDAIGIDFEVELVGDQPFEFYGLLKPEEVEILPVGKKYDQIGPVEISRLGKLLAFRVKVITTGNQLPYAIYADDVLQYSGTITTTPNVNQVYEVMELPKTIMGCIFKILLGPTDVFFRYDCQVKFNPSGLETNSKWSKVR